LPRRCSAPCWRAFYFPSARLATFRRASPLLGQGLHDEQSIMILAVGGGVSPSNWARELRDSNIWAQTSFSRSWITLPSGAPHTLGLSCIGNLAFQHLIVLPISWSLSACSPGCGTSRAWLSLRSEARP
jgi:hypothetical protein